MKIKHVLIVCLTLTWIAACQPVAREPVFASLTGMAATALPIPSAAPRLVATLPERIQSFDVSPDLNILALATSKGLVLYDLHTWEHLRTLENTGNVFSVAWSPDGKKVAVGSMILSTVPSVEGGTMGKAHLSIWDTSTWKIVLEPDFGDEMLAEMLRDLAWSHDNRFLAVSTDLAGVFVFDARTGRVISHQTGFNGSVVSISWSPDSTRLVASGDTAYTIRRWVVSSDRSVRLFDQRVGNAMQVAWSADGRRIASGHVMGGVCLWTAATNRCDGFIQAHRTAVFSLAWSPDGTRLATGGGVIRIWDAQTGKIMTAFGEDDRLIYNRLEWPGVNQPLVTLETALENPGQTMVRLWDVSNGSILVELRGDKVPE